MSALAGTRILIVDDDCVSRSLLTFQLKHAGCEVVEACDGQEAWDLLQSLSIDCLITDEQMPKLTGQQLCRLVRADPRWLYLPIVMITSKCLEIDAALLREQMSIISVLPKPFSPRGLYRILADSIGVRRTPEIAVVPSRGLRMVLAEDNYGTAVTFATLLRRAGHSVTVVHDGPCALQISCAERPDVALLDIGLPRMDGYEVARELREGAGFQEMWLIAVTSDGGDGDREKSLEAGFDHHYVKPIDFSGLQNLLCGLGSRVGSSSSCESSSV